MDQLYRDLLGNPSNVPLVAAFVGAIVACLTNLVLAWFNTRGNRQLKEFEYQSEYYKELSLHRLKIHQEFEEVIWPAFIYGTHKNEYYSLIFEDVDSFVLFYWEVSQLKAKSPWLTRSSFNAFEKFTDGILQPIFEKVKTFSEEKDANEQIKDLALKWQDPFTARLQVFSEALHISYFELHDIDKLKREHDQLQKALNKNLATPESQRRLKPPTS